MGAKESPKRGDLEAKLGEKKAKQKSGRKVGAACLWRGATSCWPLRAAHFCACLCSLFVLVVHAVHYSLRHLDAVGQQNEQKQEKNWNQFEL